ncbi:aminotransferase class I/II-fold pyridoxal phosphate-dependent enzyme [Cochleicola gelatinilyticus]|uniref:8-amino-7-oxononanoate synthase n=1 Tax=Cochleicola gelatinilyticus TaxID=1763537 RepID=A0A167IUM2_9FLAO|nr:8-amino-7-oxononanoate synthase [Cochleicola gelatinilyticus]OAB80030.1 8-amino-7-oxononanoate synthase [Cochleicola gelatinilyticus]
MLPKKLKKKLNGRKLSNSLRSLSTSTNRIDFSSNDYLGYSFSNEIGVVADALVVSHHLSAHGATGSRLLTGHHSLFNECENFVAAFHHAESALIFNSGYDANIGFFQSVPQRGDLIFYDEYIHASIRDGISMCHAKSYKFPHNDLEALKKKVKKERQRTTIEAEVYIVTESVFSMDGDAPDLFALSNWCAEHNVHLIIDEAHAVGVFGKHGNGLVQHLGIEQNVFARIVTFGKALGCHGAAILGSEALKQYLINFARSFIYTTALPPYSVAAVLAGYQILSSSTSQQEQLHYNIAILQNEIKKAELSEHFITSNSAIHCCKVSGNQTVKNLADHLQKSGFDVRPILSPTVPEGSERLRICLHSFNTEEEIVSLVHHLKILLT